jgi:glyoxylase-like metal-dependent hydrolase (beta-lactamase superfamily II)
MGTPLAFNVFTAPEKPVVGERPRPFGPPLAWDPMTSTLIFGENDAVLVDTLTTVAEAEALADWVALHNRNLATIYITHGHIDHFAGLSVLLQRFPDARAIATPKSVDLMHAQRQRLPIFRKFWPGQLPRTLAFPEPYDNDVFTLEGHELRILEQGRTDTVDTTSLRVPSIGLVVAGDVVYNECHMYVGETTPESRGTGSPRSTAWRHWARRRSSPVTRSPASRTHQRPSRRRGGISSSSAGRPHPATASS